MNTLSNQPYILNKILAYHEEMNETIDLNEFIDELCIRSGKVSKYDANRILKKLDFKEYSLLRISVNDICEMIEKYEDIEPNEEEYLESIFSKISGIDFRFIWQKRLSCLDVSINVYLKSGKEIDVDKYFNWQGINNDILEDQYKHSLGNWITRKQYEKLFDDDVIEYFDKYGVELPESIEVEEGYDS